MYLQGFPIEYSFLGRFPMDYHFLQGLGASTNNIWVDNFQNPFNQNILFPAADLAKTDKAAAYAKLAPAFAKIQQDAINFVNQYSAQPAIKASAQATIDGWKAHDWPLIQGFLNDWAASVPQPVGITPLPAPIPVFDTPVNVSAPMPVPSITGGVPISSPGASLTTYGPTYAPTAPTAAPVASIASTMEDWLPWIGGAVALGLLLQSRKKS